MNGKAPLIGVTFKTCPMFNLKHTTRKLLLVFEYVFFCVCGGEYMTINALVLANI